MRRGSTYVYAQCKECFRRYSRAHYIANKSDYLARAQAARDAYEPQIRRFIAKYFRDHPCVDCGETDPVVLQFDHCRGKKDLSVSVMVKRRFSLKRIQAEIAKCDVRCANCHTRRTARQFGWWSTAL